MAGDYGTYLQHFFQLKKLILQQRTYCTTSSFCPTANHHRGGCHGPPSATDGVNKDDSLCLSLARGEPIEQVAREQAMGGPPTPPPPPSLTCATGLGGEHLEALRCMVRDHGAGMVQAALDCIISEMPG